MSTFEGYPSEEDSLTSYYRMVEELSVDQSDATADALDAGLIDEGDVLAAEFAFDGDRIIEDYCAEESAEVGQMREDLETILRLTE